METVQSIVFCLFFIGALEGGWSQPATYAVGGWVDCYCVIFIVPLRFSRRTANDELPPLHLFVCVCVRC